MAQASTSEQAPANIVGSIQEMESEKRPTGKEFTRRLKVTWKINNYLHLTKNTPFGQHVISPLYDMDLGKLMNSCQFQFILYPRGKEEDSRDYISIYILFRNNVDVQLSTELFFLKSDVTPNAFHKTSYCTVNAGTRHGKDRPMHLSFFVKNQSDYLNNAGELRIGCELMTKQEKTLNNDIPSSSYRRDVETLDSELALAKTINKELCDALPLYTDSQFQHLSDVTIVCEEDGKVFNCHKIFLSLRSSVFKSYFVHDTKERNEGKINIKDMSSETLESLLYFIYTDDVKKSMIGPKLLAAAQRYDIQRLKLRCERFLLDKIDVSNCLECWIVANYHEAKVLERATIRFIARNWASVKETENFNTIVKDYPELQTSVISYMTSSQDS